jgi:hypothetical protein
MDPMKRTEIVALSGAAVQRLSAKKVGIVGMTKMQSEKLAEHKKKKAAGAQKNKLTAS